MAAMRTLLLLCAATALFSGLSVAGSAGRDFVLSFLKNYVSDNRAQLQLFITAVEGNTQVTIKTSLANVQQVKIVSFRQTITVTIPPSCELDSRQRNLCSVMVHATADVTITALNYKDRTADTSVVYPITEWGTEYYVLTPTNLNNKEFSVTNGKDGNKVIIFVDGEFVFRGGTHRKGSQLLFNLKPYESVIIESVNDLTGTRVTSLKPVAVFTGHTCTRALYTYCNHVYEQLLPVNKWGSTFIVPPVPLQSRYDTVYVTASQPTKIDVKSGKSGYSMNLAAGMSKLLQTTKNDPLYLQADHGIQVLMYFSGVQVGKSIYDAFLTTVVSEDRYCSHYSLRALKDFDNKALVVVSDYAVPTLTLDNGPVPLGTSWQRFPGTKYLWALIDCNSGNFISNSREPFALYSLGFAERNGYGSAGQCVRPDMKIITEKPSLPSERSSLQFATCWAMGDPHYSTFDGRRFDFMGTCTYVIAKNCTADNNLQGFEVLAENENRGNRRVSYVGMVTVKVYGTTITVVQSEKGRVRIDNTLWSLPVALNNNKLVLSQSGQSVIIETDFGLIVRYDWDNRLFVSLTQSYAGKTCGLCGNFNGNPNDDFRTPSGTQANTTVTFGSSWKVQGIGQNAQCRDDCVGGCGSCTHKNMQHWQDNTFCGIITQTNGPFHKCHSTINPQVYLDNCKYDVCMAAGNRHFLCKALEDYAEMCQTSGIPVQEWRKLSRCPIKCPANSHYELCGSACPATCSEPNAPSKCKRPCVQTCTCNNGFVLSENRCVRASSCGCTYEGRYIPAGESFWADTACRQWCKCNPGDRKLKCVDKSCRAGEQCKLINGVRKCHTLSQSTCHSRGDPHYLTFDKKRFDFQGTCVYQLAALCINNTELEHFEIRVQNEHRHSKIVSFTKLVEIKVYSLSIIITTSYKGKILVNNQLVNLPVTLDEGRIVVQKNGGYGAVTTDFGLKVTFDWGSQASVTLPGTYQGAVCGLCGNYNGEHADDLVPKNGGKPVSPPDFGNSWQVAEIPGCVGGCKGVCPKCDINQKIQYEQKNFCGIIKDPSGPFRECHSIVNPAEFFEDCVFDVCLYKGRQNVLCEAVASYTDACQNAGAKVYNWRTSQFCAMKCPVHSHYELCASGCQTSCMSLVSPVACISKCKEGCSCDDGYVLSGDVCVPMSKCGCLYGGRYYQSGQVFYPSEQCQEQCKCKQDGEVECKEFKCGPNEECKIVKGIQKCQPVGSAVCQAAGDPHYTSYDGLKFDFQGTCTYTLSESCGTKGSNLVDFAVKVENVAWERNKVVSVTKLVAVEVYGFTVIMKHKMSGILVNDVLTPLPVNLNDGAVKVYKQGNRYYIKTDFELTVTYDLVYHVTVAVPGNYKGKVCGLCGNYNGDKNDDFRQPNGVILKDVNSFGASWKVNIPGVTCTNGCTAANCPNCKAPHKALFSQSTYCGIMTAPNGPFKTCHKQLDPKLFFDDCVFDVCASNGEGTVLCNSVAAYAFSCHKAGVDIKNWRTSSFCPMKCPANSHYEVCADNWALSCPGLTNIVPSTKECTEGCECNDGFSFDGEKCIKEKTCGCFDNGRSYKPGEMVYEENCGKKCTCKPDKGLVCEEHSCPKNTKCLVRKGVRGCYHTDPCQDLKCRVKEKCTVVKGEASCVPMYTGTCWAWGDPHYHTFDNYNFDFQGTCKYVISETCGALDGLVPFSVTERNDNRGNTRVSYVREAHVSVYGHLITVRKNQVGHITVDGQLLNLPVQLGEGKVSKVSMLQRGGTVVIETDFGLIVSYDWNWHLVIKLPSSYYNSVCGLCGNFNGNSADERKDRAGKAVSSVIEWGKSWQTPDQDKDSPCYVCEKNCPVCAESKLKLYQTQAFCGALTAKNELFRTCHQQVNPQAFFDSCVYDTCMNDGDKKMVCQALASYISQCSDKGVIIRGWRKKYGCPMNCPPHSHYEECTSPCQRSCPFPDKVEVCTRNCVESCVCDRGYVLSGGVCVPQTKCGCTYEGRYYEPDQRFWADEKCGRRCQCDTTLGLVKCQAASCSAKEVCTLVDGVRTCVATSEATCSASGDPHYHTFDGHRFDFQGTCVYQLVRLCSGQEGLEPFNVTVQNDHRGSTAVSFTKTVKLYIYGIILTLSRQYPKRILLNDELAMLPLEYSDKLKVSGGSQRAVVSTAAGITVTFDWGSTVRVTLPSTYQGAVCGLCGNYNGKNGDDLTMSNGQTTKSGDEFGKSWLVALTADCSSACVGPRCQECSDQKKSKFGDQNYCGVIANKEGPFKNCHKKVDPGPFLQDCVYDACQYHGHFGAICDAIQTYASACQSNGITIDTWRRQNFCPMACPVNSHYTLCASACPTTCASLTSLNKCHKACVEGCECNEGHLLSGDTCVPVKDCGCSYQGRYYKKGDIFYPSSQCEEKCVCGVTGAVICQKNKCPNGEQCKLLNGVHGCHPIKHDKCVASGDPHYISFDKKRFDFQGTCTYVLAKPCNLGQSSLPAFTVIQGNQKYGNGKVAVTKTITVQVFGYDITIKQGMSWKVILNNELVNLPLSLDNGRLQVTQQGKNIIVQTDFGLKVLYNAVYYVEVIVPSSYQQKMCGLCGNNNNNPGDDFKLPNGKITTNIDEFGKSWALDKESQGCEGCGKQCPVCPPDKEALYKKTDSCGIISDPKGPFKACHKVIDPAPYLSHCVFDVCAMSGNKDTQCNNVMAYALACQGEGVQIQPWRSNSFCPASCPPNSHYELSGSTCGGSCASFIRQFPCSEKSFEGCHCNPGFVFDANKCVPLENCGCVYNGRYLRVGETVTCTKCKSKCTCKASGVMSCQEISCVNGEECGIKDGARGCFIKQKKCSISQTGHITSFDAMSGAMATKGAFELTSLCDQSNEQWFRVVVDTRVCKKGASPTVATLYVFFKDTTVAVNSQHIIWVNGKKESRPSKLANNLSIQRTGNAVVIDVTPDVRVTYSKSQEVTVTVSGILTNKLCGACGNNNDELKDDMWTADGKATKKVDDIVASWSAGDFSKCGL